MELITAHLLLILGIGIVKIGGATTGVCYHSQNYTGYQIEYRRGYETYAERYTISCGAIGWSRCNRYRSARRSYQYSTSVAVPQYTQVMTCCDGYTGSPPNCEAHCPAGCLNDGACATHGNCTCFDGWTGDDCTVGVPCPSLSNPENGTTFCSLGDDGNSSYQDTCNFTCNAGYELTGSDNRTCQSDGSWSGNETMCIRVLGCHLSQSCNDTSITIPASSTIECCDMGGASFNSINETECISACALVEGDPHFTVPLLSKQVLCYSIQGYSGLAFNLIYNKDFVINAMFVDTEGDTSETTWIGKMAVIPHNTNNPNIVVFDSVSQEVEIIGEGNLKAAMTKKIIFSQNGTVKFTQSVNKQSGNPVIHVVYSKPQANFDVTFYNNHLNVDWRMNYDEFHDSHGLMGQFMKKGLSIDTQREMLIYSDGRDPVSVTKDSVMTGKLCWKAKNYGYQGEGLIEGDILDYVVVSITDIADNINKKFIKEN